MNKSSSSASSTPQSQKQLQRATTTPPSIIPLDYNYQTMSPSAFSQQRACANSYSHRAIQSVETPVTTISLADVDSNQYSSLFGDPVPPPPPPTDFLDSAFDSPPFFRSNSAGNSSEEDAFGRTVTLSDVNTPGQARLFSEVPYSSFLSRRRFSQVSAVQNNFDVLPIPVPRLQPPDIQILPNSSGGSGSSEARDSPNYALLNPDDILRKPTLYELAEPADTSELIETMTISDATGTREYTEATRRVSNISDDFKPNIGSISFSPPTMEIPESSTFYSRQFSNESYSSSDWFHPATHDFPEFSKMPKLRPSSKNVMSIKRDEMPTQHSPVAAMINDSNGSSSGEERIMDTTQTLERPTVSLDALAPARPPDPEPSLLREVEEDILQSSDTYLPYTQHRRSSLDPNFPPPPPAAPPPISPTQDEPKSFIREMSPVILRDSIATGSNYRVEDPRLHKKTSFTIISDKSPQSSRPQSPTAKPQNRIIPSTAQRHAKPTDTTSTSPSPATAQPIAKPRYHLQQKSLTSTQLKLPKISQTLTQQIYDDSPRPSVQFNMSGRYSPSKMPQKGILQHRESLINSSSLQDATTTLPQTPASTQRRGSILPGATLLTHNDKAPSHETLPLITDPYRTSIPRLHRSHLDISVEPTVIPPGALPRPLKPNPNPTRKQKGLLRVINSADSLSRIPLRSNWASMDDLAFMQQRHKPTLSPLRLQQRRRSSSTSPERRSSTQTGSDRRSSNLSSITTSDFSFRRPSLLKTPQSKRRTSIVSTSKESTKRRQSILTQNNNVKLGSRTPRTKIAKPSTLSPIIGTPNKEINSPHHSPTRVAKGHPQTTVSDSPSDTHSRRNSVSKIPVRSAPNSRMNSQPSSRVQSRSNSPLKEFAGAISSRAQPSRTPSRTTIRSESQSNSRANSQAPSRSTSRASTRLISAAMSQHGSSRPNSRMEQARDLANSRSNSRLSMRSTSTSRPRAVSVSPPSGRRKQQHSSIPSRRKSISLSPTAMRRAIGRPRSKSPTKKNKGDRSLERRNSRSRIPTRTNRSPTHKSPGKSKSPNKSKSPGKSKPRTTGSSGRVPRKSPTTRKPPVPRRQEASSAKKSPKPARKTETGERRSKSPGGKQSSISMKRQPSNLQKPAVGNLKREPSNLRKPATAETKAGAAKSLKRETSNISGKKSTSTATGLSDQKKQPVAKSTSKPIDAKPLTKASESKSIKEPSEPEIIANGTVTTTEEAIKVGAVAGATTNATPGSVGGSMSTITSTTDTSQSASPRASGPATGTLKRQPSSMTLLRMGSKISLMSKKRSDSNLSKRSLAAQPLLEASDSTEEANAQGTQQLSRLGTGDDLPTAILEKSQKTLETIQKTVTNATDEIHKTINENLTDLKSLEQDMGKMSDGATSPTSSVATVVENKAAKAPKGAVTSVSRTGTAEGTTATATTSVTAAHGISGRKEAASMDATQKSPLPPTQPIEAAVSIVHPDVVHAETAERVSVSARAISVMPEVDCESANFQNFEFDIEDKASRVAGLDAVVAGDGMDAPTAVEHTVGGDLDMEENTEAKRRSPDGQGGSATGSGGKTGSQEFLEEQDENRKSPGCCACCARFCMPCRRSRCSQCCRRNKTKSKGKDEYEQPVLSATSSTTTTNLEVIDETEAAKQKKKRSCWQKLNCCGRCRRKKTPSTSSPDETATAEQAATLETTQPGERRTPQPGPPKQSKCGLCLSKVFCCRSVNKIETTSGMETEVKKCCFCIPCRRKRGVAHGTVAAASPATGTAAAWQDPERGITSTDASVLEGTESEQQRPGCCKRFWGRFLCCRKKPPIVPSDSRRTSIKAPPPAEDTRRKLHVDLVEYNSKMKGAIPVLPLYLAWFCAICNVLIPGLGTLLSGFFCVCLGIPRFSQYDSAKARFGAFIINTIVAMAQFFCVLFCFVGWGWSIWWGTIMLKCARKLNKIKKVERLEMEEERRQAEAAAAATAVTTHVTYTESEPAKT